MTRLPVDATKAQKATRHIEESRVPVLTKPLDLALAVNMENPGNPTRLDQEDAPPTKSTIGVSLDTHLAIGKQPGDA